MTEHFIYLIFLLKALLTVTAMELQGGMTKFVDSC